jgi:predicted Zn-dependent peptidase
MREAKVKFDASPQLMMAFHKPTVPSRDDYIFDLITYVLCGGDNSRLRRTLIFEKKLVRTMGCDSSHPGVRLDNLFVIEAEPIAGKSYAEVKDAVWDVINELAEKGLDEAGLLTAKNNVLKDFVFGLDKNEDVANALSYFELVTGSWKYMVRQPEVIEGITSKEIVATMKRYMTKENMTVVELVK